MVYNQFKDFTELFYLYYFLLDYTLSSSRNIVGKFHSQDLNSGFLRPFLFFSPPFTALPLEKQWEVVSEFGLKSNMI